MHIGEPHRLLRASSLFDRKLILQSYIGINNNFSISKQKSLKLKHKFYSLKRKIGIEFWGYGPNSLEIRG